jgi:hypothetical protein
MGDRLPHPPIPARGPNRRIGWIDATRGIGIILVVYGHAERSLVTADLFPPTPGILRQDELIYAFHTPLFFLLSGLFAGRSAERGGGCSLPARPPRIDRLSLFPLVDPADYAEHHRWIAGQHARRVGSAAADCVGAHGAVLVPLHAVIMSAWAMCGALLAWTVFGALFIVDQRLPYGRSGQMVGIVVAAAGIAGTVAIARLVAPFARVLRALGAASMPIYLHPCHCQCCDTDRALPRLARCPAGLSPDRRNHCRALAALSSLRALPAARLCGMAWVRPWRGASRLDAAPLAVAS